MATISNGESGSSVRDKLNKAMNTYAVASGTNTYTASLSSGITLADNPTIRILFTNANTAASPTLNMNSGGAVTIKKAGSVDLGIGDIIAGTIYTLTYDGTNWQSDIGIAGKLYDWVPVFTGYSAAPTISVAKYRVIDGCCEIFLRLGFNSGTSNATTLTFTGPFNAVAAGATGVLLRIVNGGVAQTTTGMAIVLSAASNVITCCTNSASTSSTGWTGSSGKSFNLDMAYFIA